MYRFTQGGKLTKERGVEDATKRGVWWGYSLEEWAFKMFEEKKTDTPEFRAVLGVYGKKKLTEIYEKWKSTKRSI